MKYDSQMVPISALINQLQENEINEPHLSTLSSLRISNIKKQLGVMINKPMEARLSDGTTLPMKLPYIDNSIRINMPRNSPEFLMAVAPLQQGITLHGMMTRFGNGNIYGPITLKLLNEIGYATIDRPENIRFEPFRTT